LCPLLKAYVAKGEGSGGKCLMVSDVSQMRGYNTDGGNEDTKEREDLCFTAKPLSLRFNELDELINKVQSIFVSFKVPQSSYEKELKNVNSRISHLDSSLTQTRVTNSNLTDQISRVFSKSEERRMWIELKESELIKSKDENIYLQRDNLKLLKQRNVFCLIAKRLYTNITQLHLNCEIGQKIHRMILPFLEFKEDEINAEAYNCESVVSSEDVKFDIYVWSRQNRIFHKVQGP